MGKENEEIETNLHIVILIQQVNKLDQKWKENASGNKKGEGGGITTIDHMGISLNIKVNNQYSSQVFTNNLLNIYF